MKMNNKEDFVNQFKLMIIMSKSGRKIIKKFKKFCKS